MVVKEYVDGTLVSQSARSCNNAMIDVVPKCESWPSCHTTSREGENPTFKSRLTKELPSVTKKLTDCSSRRQKAAPKSHITSIWENKWNVSEIVYGEL